MTDHKLVISFTEICQAVNLSEQNFVELIEHDIVQAKGDEPNTWHFDVAMVGVARRAVRLHQDLDLEWSAIALIVELIEQRDQLEAENESLRRSLERFLHK